MMMVVTVMAVALHLEPRYGQNPGGVNLELERPTLPHPLRLAHRLLFFC
jgi:hypothetical protein